MSGVRHLPWFAKILVKVVPLLILMGWTWQPGRLLNLPPPIRKKSSGRVLGFNSATCYISVTLKFGIVRVQKDPAKIMNSVPVKFRISKMLGFMFPINLD
jgi:hypothetical protein